MRTVMHFKVVFVLEELVAFIAANRSVCRMSRFVHFTTLFGRKSSFAVLTAVSFDNEKYNQF